jgi:glycosyltransferase involved in cell wall biosynthesis
MKILLVNDYGDLNGGAEVIVRNLRNTLRARGHEVLVFASSAGPRTESFFADETGYGTTSRWRTLVQTVNYRAARALRRVLSRFRPDVIHVNLYLTQLSPLILREFREIPSVYYAQWYRAICPLGTRRRPTGETCDTAPGVVCLHTGCLPLRDWPLLALQRQLDQAWGNRFTRVAAISQAVARRLTQFGAPHLRNPEVIYPGIEVASPRPNLTTQPTIVTAGRLVPEKGIDVLIRAFAKIANRHPQAQLIVLGDGPLMASMQYLAAELKVGDRVIFRGQVSHSETLATFRSAWVTCVPSLWEEPFGMTAAEAQMHGTAVIASGTGGLAEIVVESETGFLVRPGDVDTLAARLQSIVADRDLAWSLGVRGRQRAEECFSLCASAARFENLYAAIASDRK